MNILLVVSRYPWPPRRGDQLRTVQTLRGLVADHRVTLLAPDPGDAAGEIPAELADRIETVPYRRPGAMAKALGVVRAAVSGRPLQSGLYDAPDLRRLLRRHRTGADLCILQLARLVTMLRELEDVPLVVDLIDSLALNFSRRAAFDRPWLRPLLRFEAGRLETAERRLFERARRLVLVSERDRRWLRERWSLHGAETERLAVVPLAVPSGAGGEGGEVEGEDGEVWPSSAAPVLAVTGNLGYWVNTDAVLWWLEEVWPTLSTRRSELRLVVAGARPPVRLARAVAAAGGELIASPPDLGAVLAQATVALAPMRGGSGVPVKILEAWSLGIPVVASPWAAQGADGRPGEDLLVAETRDGWLDAILTLLDDTDLYRRLGAAGRRRLADEHSPRRVDEVWRAVIAAAGRRSAAHDLSPSR